MATPAEWTARSRSASVKEHWLVKLYYGNETNFLGISDIDIIVDQQYYGVVQDFGEITKTLNLRDSIASIGSTTIICQNAMKNGTLSELIFGVGTPSTDAYLNRKVLIYSTLGDTTIGNCFLLGRFVLANITHNHESVYLELEEWQPWYALTLPREQIGGRYFPLVYGTFTAESSTPNSPQFCHDAKCWPAPIRKTTAYQSDALVYPGASGNQTVHFYEKSMEGAVDQIGLYVPLASSNSSHLFGITSQDSVPDDTGDKIQILSNMRRGLKFLATSEGGGDFTVFGNARSDGEGSSTDKATWAYTLTSGGGLTTYKTLYLNMPNIKGFFEEFDIAFRIQVKIYSSEDLGDRPTFILEVFDATFNSSATFRLGDAKSIGIVDLAGDNVGGDWCATDALYDCSASGGYDPTTSDYYDTIGVAGQYISDEYTYNLEGLYKLIDPDTDLITGEFPNKMRIGAYIACSAPAGGTEVKFAISIAGFSVKKAVIRYSDDNDNVENTYARDKFDLEHLYCGFDGPVNMWDSSAITECQQIHREILQTHLGMATADIDTTAWGALDTARNGWDARFWFLDPTSIRKMLDELQFNGGFITYWKGDKLTYDYIKDSYSSGDVVYTLDTKDYDGLEIMLTPYSDLITKRIYKYDRDAGSDKLTETSTFTNTTTRTDYSIGTDENIEDIDLKFLTANVTGGANPNDSLGKYSDNIFGSFKVMAVCDVVRPDKWDLDIGDIIKFDNADIDPFGYAWSDIYFKIVETRRSINNLGIVAREVYRT